MLPRFLIWCFQKGPNSKVENPSIFDGIFYLWKGVRDRHNDNIMIGDYGEIIHIDFGHILDNRKNKFGVERDRTDLFLS